MLKYIHNAPRRKANLVWLAFAAMLALPIGAWGAATAAPQETPLVATAGLPYGTGFERRQLALAEHPTNSASDALPAGNPSQGQTTRTGGSRGAGQAGGQGHGRAR